MAFISNAQIREETQKWGLQLDEEFDKHQRIRSSHFFKPKIKRNSRMYMGMNNHSCIHSECSWNYKRETSETSEESQLQKKKIIITVKKFNYVANIA